MQIRRPTPALTAVGIICILLFFRLSTQQDLNERTGRRYSVAVKLVYDGDTFETTTGQKVRLLGIDAPEVAHYGKPADPFGDESGVWLSQQLLNQTVTVEEGVETIDRYGRTLGWIYAEDGCLINETSLATGNAKLLARFGLPLHLEGRLRTAEATARQQKLGLWATGTEAQF